MVQVILGGGGNHLSLHDCWQNFKGAYLEASYVILPELQIMEFAGLREVFIGAVEEYHSLKIQRPKNSITWSIWIREISYVMSYGKVYE